ncbi:MAG: ABC transporter permease [Rhodospirillales bacterium]
MKYLDALRGALDAIRGNALRMPADDARHRYRRRCRHHRRRHRLGARAVVVEQIQSLGSNLIVIDARSSLWLSDTDATAIKAEVPGVQIAEPILRGGLNVTSGNILWPTTVNGVTQDFLEVRDWPLLSGRNFEPEEISGGAKVVLLGATIARVLFGDANPIGQAVRLKQVPHMVIGVLCAEGDVEHRARPGRHRDCSR